VVAVAGRPFTTHRREDNLPTEPTVGDLLLLAPRASFVIQI